MGQYEDELMRIYKEVNSTKGLKLKFDEQCKKMHMQSKHAHKTGLEIWEYALARIKGWSPDKSKKK